AAKSMSKPVGFPPFVVFSIGGNVGLSQYLNDVPFAARWLAPAVPAAARDTATSVSRESRTALRIRSSLIDPVRDRSLERCDEDLQLAYDARIDRVADRRLVVERLRARLHENVARSATELDR